MHCGNANTQTFRHERTRSHTEDKQEEIKVKFNQGQLCTCYHARIISLSNVLFGEYMNAFFFA